MPLHFWGIAVFYKQYSFRRWVQTDRFWANEFWYYILFPAILVPFTSAGSARTIFGCACVVAAIATVGWGLMALFPIWLLGAALVGMPRCPILLHSPTRRGCLVIAVVVFGSSMIVAQTRLIPSEFAASYGVGVKLRWLDVCYSPRIRNVLVPVVFMVCRKSGGLLPTRSISCTCRSSSALPRHAGRYALATRRRSCARIFRHLSHEVFVLGYCAAHVTEARTDEIRRHLFSKPATKPISRSGCAYADCRKSRHGCRPLFDPTRMFVKTNVARSELDRREAPL